MSPVQIIFNLMVSGAGILAIWLLPPSYYQMAFSIWFATDLISNSIFEYYFPDPKSQDNSDEHTKFQLVLRSWLLPLAAIGAIVATYYFFTPPVLIIRVLLTLLLAFTIYKSLSDLRGHRDSSPRHA
jgi:hypothetical protein